MTTMVQPEPAQTEPQHLARDLCAICLQPVMWVLVGSRACLVDMFEWLPRMACPSCLHTRRAHPGRTVHCSKCANTGYVGSDRPAGRMVAIDVAWSDDEDDQALPHVRIIGPSTDRRRGEALHPFHVCQIPATSQRNAA